MSVLKAAVKRLFLFVNNSFPIYHHESCQGCWNYPFRPLSTLMCVPQQVVNSLYRIECQDWNFYEYSNPISHGSIP